MKTNTIYWLIAAIIVSFWVSAPLEAEEKPIVYIVAHEPLSNIQARHKNQRYEQAKHERYLQYQQRQRALHEKTAAQQPIIRADATKGDGVQIDTNKSTLNSTSSYSGNYTLLGTCTNTGGTSAVFAEVNVDFYGAGNSYLGSDSAYIMGGTNAKLTSTGSFTNALYPGDTGFFQVSTTIDYGMVEKAYIQNYTYDTYAHSKTNASLGFVGDPAFSAGYSDYLTVSGQVKNSSPNWLTYFNDVYFAIFNTGGKVVDVDYTFVQGSTYDTGVVTTDSALNPGETGSFSNSFYGTPYSTFDSYLYSLQWYETSTGAAPEEKDPPFGSFDTPLDGSTVRSSVPVTGWALDDSGVEHVKIYRHSGGSLVYIGDATFVEGARPDVAAAYPGYPDNSSAGWGYMMLTNFLPGGGNGSFTIEAIATDAVGKTTSLGTKTINCDNAHAVKPFGAIDTPTQGGTASGSGFINWGWALTPQPNSIPTDGSTINVLVDSVNIGNPTYNIYRSDIATFFPSYDNSNGAVGYFYLDTTAYECGVHTIQWTARDTGNNSDGIGSRFFTISNPRKPAASAQAAISHISEIAPLPTDHGVPINVKRLLNPDIPCEEIAADETGKTRIVVRELEPIEIHLPQESAAAHYTGWLKVNDRLMELPTGSTLDRETGTFHWMPAPAFHGRYNLVFIQHGPDGPVSKKELTIEIIPKHTN